MKMWRTYGVISWLNQRCLFRGLQNRYEQLQPRHSQFREKGHRYEVSVR